MAKTWLITGCSSGFGRLIAEAALALGDRVVATARDKVVLNDLAEKYPQTARVAALDVTKDVDAADAVRLALDAFGSLDVLVNNAGFGLVGAIEEATPAEYRPMYETNVFGLIEVTRAALPALRQSGNGRIVNFSSVGGIAGRAGFGLYNGTKFAVEGISEALAQEVAPFGIRVLIVEPGAFRTNFLGRSIAATARELTVYDDTVGRTRHGTKANNGRQTGDPQKAVAVLIQAICSGSPPLHLPLGKDAYARARSKIEAFAKDMELWEEYATATDFDAS